MENNSKPSFYAIIPAHVRYCKELEPGAKLLYGELTALASSEGYCWASNRYLASLYDVDQKTIQRWIKSLKKQKFIITEVEIGGFQTIRKIWISPEIKKISKKGQKCQEGEQKVVRPDDKNVLHINTGINTEKNNNNAASQLAAFLLQKIKSMKPDFSKQVNPKWIKDFTRLIKLRSEDQIKKIIMWIFETSTWKWNEIILSPSNLLKHLDQLEMQMTKRETSNGISKEWIEKLKERVGNNTYLTVTNEGFAYHAGQLYQLIKYTDHGYQEQIKSRLRKMNISVDGL